MKSVLDFEDFSSFFDAVMRQRKLQNKKFSYRHLCRQLGLKSTSQIAMIATGHRTPTPELFHKLCEKLKLTDKETMFAQALLDLQRSRSDTERKFCLERLQYFRASEGTKLMELDTFEFMSAWYHIAIIETTKLLDFKSDPEWIARRLGKDIDVETVRTSLALLTRLGFLEQLAEGTYRATSASLTTPHNIPSAAIRHYHEQMLHKATEALHHQPVDSRFFCGVTLPIDVSRLQLAQEAILEFRDRLFALAQTGENQEVYHLGVQFFRVTEPLEPSLAK